MKQDIVLYDSLVDLTKKSEAFFCIEDGNFRTFSYRLGSYSDFLLPNALEARGIMFHLNGGTPELVCRPFKKFFNLGENPMVIGLDLDKVFKGATKEDGSLISTYWCPESQKMKLKSKQSLSSYQANLAMQVLDLPKNADLRWEADALTRYGYTVMFELVSPLNRIVLEYPSTELRVIGVRRIEDGVHFHREDFSHDLPAIAAAWVGELSVDKTFVESIPFMTGIEGYVLTMEDGLMVKVKTEWYQALHRLKDSVDSDKALFEAIIDERVDDVKTMFSTDTVAMDRIAKMEAEVIPKFNHIVSTTENFYKANKELSRKDFAILGQKALGEYFHLAIQMYLGNPPDYKGYAKKFRKEVFGIVDKPKLE